MVFAFWSTERETLTQSSTTAYNVVDLGTLGGATSAALAIDYEEGSYQLVGYAQTASGATHAFVGTPGNPRDLGTLGGANSEAWSARMFRGIVGRSQSATGAYHAFWYDNAAQQMNDLGTLGGSQSYATGIDWLGTVVGASLLPGDSVTRAFIYQNGAMSQLGATLGGSNTVAHAIGESGEVVGRADLPGNTTHHAFLYANGTTTDLGTLGTNSEAYGINPSGIIVGRSQLTNGVQRAFRYAGGTLQDLGTLGGAASEAHGINAGGAIVGWAETSTGARRAFIWRNGVMTDLNSLIPGGSGWILEAATGIEEMGAVVGYGTHNGVRRAFVLWPPLDLRIGLQFHGDIYNDTNIPNPHEAGQVIPMGVSIYAPVAPTGLTLIDNLTGPAEYVSGSVRLPTGEPADCQQSGQTLTCHIPHFQFGGTEAHLFYNMRSTGAGVIEHSVSVSADQPDPDPSNNSGTESNTAISLASLTLNATSVAGGRSVLGRATITSPAGGGGATVRLASSNPSVASVPAYFDVLPGCCDNGLWREFYVTTSAVSGPVTVQISATYGLVTKVVPLTVLPSNTQQPFGGTPWPVPGTIQAEDFDDGGETVAYHDATSVNSGGAYRPTGVDLEGTRDTGGGVNVGWISAGEWLEYTVSIASSGSYTLAARVASSGTGGTFHVEVDGVNKTGPMSISNTGGWQVWTTISRAVTLDAGSHIIRVAFDTNGISGAVGNLNYLRLTSNAAGPTPYGGTPRSLPGIVQAEDFDEGGEAVAYHDTSGGNAGGQYRTTGVGVDIERTTDTNGGYNVGWMAPTEWLNYTVSVTSSGTYTLTARVAANGAGGTFHVEVGGRNVTGPLTIPNTGGWQNWTNVTATVSLSAGVQWMRFVADSAGATGVFGNLNYLQVVASSAAPEIVLYGTDFARFGTWMLQSDTTAAGGQKVLTPDDGLANTSAPLANPSSYIQATFTAPAATPYTLWLRIRGTGDTKYSESVWVQYSDARANGAAVYPLNTTSGLLVNLENCSGCGVLGWGWQNRAYWLTQAATVTFANSGTHTIRIQMREDGAQIDQVVLSPSRYLSARPGLLKNDTTIVAP